MTTSQFEKQQQEEQTTFLQNSPRNRKNPYTPTSVQVPVSISSLAQTSANSENTINRKYYIGYLPNQLNVASVIYADQVKDTGEEKVKNSDHEIAVYDLTQPSKHQASWTKADQRERRARFLSSLVNNFIGDLPRAYKILEAVKHQQKKIEELELYLNSLRNELRRTKNTNFSERVLDLSWLVWETLKTQFVVKGLYLEVPDACPGSRDNFMYTWSRSEHYLECEIFATGEVEFFYRNRSTGEVWGEDTTLEQGFSTDILDKVSLFL